MEIINRKARHDYSIEETYEAGIVLTGTEIKSIRSGKANIRDSYVIVKNDEAFLLNTHISLYEEGNRFNHEETRTRKLLLHRKQIQELKSKTEMEGYTIIPLKMYFVRQNLKVLVGIAKGKKNYDKRESIKKKNIDMEMKKMAKYR